jgi:hypothetical protein
MNADDADQCGERAVVMLSLRSIPGWVDRTGGARTTGSFAALRITVLV